MTVEMTFDVKFTQGEAIARAFPNSRIFYSEEENETFLVTEDFICYEIADAGQDYTNPDIAGNSQLVSFTLSFTQAPFPGDAEELKKGKKNVRFY